MSVAASRLVHFIPPVFLGLTPQANCLSSLRDFTRLPYEDGGDAHTRVAASRLRSLTPENDDAATCATASRLRKVTSCGWGEASKGVAASRLHPMRSS